MEAKTTLDILKMAILMEKRGYAFYTKVAEQTQDSEIKNVFNVMAEEENLHIRFLSEQFSNFEKTRKFQQSSLPSPEGDGIATMILSEDVKNKIASAGFEAAAISAAIDMENKAIEVYSSQARITSDPNEKELYSWLADWEKGHLKVLKALDDELKEKIWFDNQFWPF
jgi:rubrerythrin